MSYIKIKLDNGINERNQYIKDFLSLPEFDYFDIEFVEWLDDNYGKFSLHYTI